MIQYVIVGPAIAVAGIVTQYYAVYCDSSLSYKYAHVYLLGIEFVSISIALYGLIVLYVLVKEDLKGRRPLAKFASIKLVIFLTYYQGFVFDLLVHYNVIKATQYWTTTNISDGLNALCICLEMVPIAAFQMWAFYWGEYSIARVGHSSNRRANLKGKTNIFLSLIHALNFTDFLVELWHELRFLWDRLRGKEYTREDGRFGKLDFVAAFNANEDDDAYKGSLAPLPLQTRTRSEDDVEMSEAAYSKSMDGASQSRRNLVTSGTAPAQPRYPSFHPPDLQDPETGLHPDASHSQSNVDAPLHERPRSWEPQAL